jgi:hypothetical protein
VRPASDRDVRILSSQGILATVSSFNLVKSVPGATRCRGAVVVLNVVLKMGLVNDNGMKIETRYHEQWPASGWLPA